MVLRPGKESGFTLVEALVAFAVISVALLVVFEAWWRGSVLAAQGERAYLDAEELRQAVMWVTTDLRKAKEVLRAAPGSLVLVQDAGSVTYSLSGDQLLREAGGAPKTVARGLAIADFSKQGSLVTAVFVSRTGKRVETGVCVYRP
jgi:type II secretory pathway pseudopilin PulG